MFLFDASQHERLEYEVEPRHLLLVHLAPGPLGVSLDVLAEPLLELVVGVEQGRHHEVKEGPELRHGVLYGGTGEQEAAPAPELEQQPPTLAAGGLDGLAGAGGSGRTANQLIKY